MAGFPGTFRGEYDPTATYNPLDIVYVGVNPVNHAEYVAVRSNTDRPVTDVRYWALLMKPDIDMNEIKPTFSISDKGTIVVNGTDSGYKIPIASVAPTDLGANLNADTSQGNYIGRLSGVINVPSQATGVATMHVIGNDEAGTQYLTTVTDGATYVRSWHDGSFTDWHQITQWS